MKAKQSTFWHPFLQTQWRNLSASNNKVQCVSTWASDNTGQCVSIQSLVKLAVPEVLPRVAQFGVDVILCLNSPTLTSGDALLSLTVYYRFPNISEAMLRGSQLSPICLTVLWRQRPVLFVSSLATRNRCPQGSYERSQLLNENCTWYLLYFSICGELPSVAFGDFCDKTQIFKTCQQWEQELMGHVHEVNLHSPLSTSGGSTSTGATHSRSEMVLNNESVWLTYSLLMFFSLPMLPSQ